MEQLGAIVMKRRRIVRNDGGISESSLISQNGFRLRIEGWIFGKDLEERGGWRSNQSNTGLFALSNDDDVDGSGDDNRGDVNTFHASFRLDVITNSGCDLE